MVLTRVYTVSIKLTSLSNFYLSLSNKLSTYIYLFIAIYILQYIYLSNYISISIKQFIYLYLTIYVLYSTPPLILFFLLKFKFWSYPPSPTGVGGGQFSFPHYKQAPLVRASKLGTQHFWNLNFIFIL